MKESKMKFYEYVLTLVHNGIVLQLTFDSFKSMFDFIESYMDTRENGDTIHISYTKKEYFL